MFVRRARGAAALLAATLVLSGPVRGSQRDGEAQADRKPSLSLRATPPVGFTPLRVRMAAELRGGSDDFADFYCPTIEWDWGDGTRSENTEDCDPYEPGRSTIKRRISVEHVYREPGGFRVQLRLKQKTRVVATTSAIVQVRGGVGSE
jgi:hypothetical protein